MNDPILCAKKLEELIDLACEAKSAFEKAAVFAATQAIANEFISYEEERQFNGYVTVLEKVEAARWHICALIGYDITNNHDQQKHKVWALGAVQTLHNVLSNRQ